MLRFEFLAAAIAIALTAGCATQPVVLPACSAANSPNSICGLMNPEDISHLPGREWVVVSQMAHFDREAEAGAPPPRPGNLLAIRVADGRRQTIFPASVSWEMASDASGGPTPGWGAADCPGRPLEDQFRPHGIAVGRHASGAHLLGVVNHGSREAVEFFEIADDDQPMLTWRGCVPMPDDISANDLALFSDGGFVVTNMMKPVESMGVGALWTLLKISAGWDTGSVYRWSPGDEIRQIPGSEGSAPNGVAISADETEIYVAQWGEANVYRVPLTEAARQRSGPEKAELAHHPDNLTWTLDGKLLTAGQGGGLGGILGCGEIETGGCGIDYGVYSIDPASFEVEPLFTGKGAASVALEVGDDIFVGVFSGDQIERVMRPLKKKR